jgi:hypothetical protein
MVASYRSVVKARERRARSLLLIAGLAVGCSGGSPGGKVGADADADAQRDSSAADVAVDGCSNAPIDDSSELCPVDPQTDDSCATPGHLCWTTVVCACRVPEVNTGWLCDCTGHLVRYASNDPADCFGPCPTSVDAGMD